MERRRRGGRCGRSGPARPVLRAGGAGDRGGAGVVLAGLGVGVAVRVVAELGQHPGAEDRSQPGLAGVDLSVRVPAKTLGHHRPPGSAIWVFSVVDQPDLGWPRSRRRRPGSRGSWRSAGARSTAWICLGPGLRRRAGGPGVRAAVIFERDSRAARSGSGARSSSSSASGASQVGEGLQRGREELPQRRRAAAGSCRVRSQISALVRAGDQLQPLDLGAVAGDRRGGGRGPAARSRPARARPRRRTSPPRRCAAPGSGPPASG